jgi:hypothetical protein
MSWVADPSTAARKGLDLAFRGVRDAGDRAREM